MKNKKHKPGVYLTDLIKAAMWRPLWQRLIDWLWYHLIEIVIVAAIIGIIAFGAMDRRF